MKKKMVNVIRLDKAYSFGSSHELDNRVTGVLGPFYHYGCLVRY